jgi:hypothetical protein
VNEPEPCEHDTVGSEQPETCDYCAYLARKYDGVEPWEDATWD